MVDRTKELDSISQEARVNGAGIAPLHPYAQWDKDHPTKASKKIEWTQEEINLAESFGRKAHHNNIKCPDDDSILMFMIECKGVTFDFDIMTAWTKGYDAAKKRGVA